MARLAVLTVCLFSEAVAHSPQGSNGERMRGSRRLWDIAAREKHIWGRCDRWDAKVSGCELNSEYKCSDRISQGPEQYDMEIVLGNLTPSRPDHPVHLAWWAPQKSQTAWNPHDSLEGCAVYRDMNEAYPDFTDPNFNGGNLVVSETGRVTIRVQNPATYFVTHWISVPHIHLRLCSNDTFAHTTQDAIIFVRNGAELVAGEAGSSLQIVSVKNYTWAERPGTGNVSDTGIAGILVWRREGTTTTLAPGQIQQLVEDTMDRMNLDALEFSPIYQCFENDQLYDHFTADCTTSCGGGAEVAHGQCVRPARFSESSVVGIWQLMGTCNEACWSQWKNVTLHDARLALADLLDVPFQEITRVSMTFHASAGRRLSTDKLATFQIMVTTKRLPKNDINTLMRTFLTDSAVAADVMNFPVSEVTMTNMNDRGEWSNVETGSGDRTDVIDDRTDPYQGAYDEKEPRNNWQTIGGIPTGDLPVGVIVGVAIAVIFAGFGFGFFILYRRRRAITEIASGERHVTAAGTIIGSGGPAPGKTVDDPTVPQKPGPTQEDLNQKAEAPW